MIELWGPLQHLAWLAGVEWPQGNEDEMWALGGDWRTAADELDDIVGDIIEAKRASLHAYPEGDGVTEMVAAFDSLISGDGSDADQSVPKLAGYFRDLGKSAYDTGTEIEYTKLMYISSLGLLAAEIAAAWIFPPTAPAVQAAAVAITRVAVRILGQRVVQAIFRLVANKFAGFVLRHVAIDTILGTLQEVGIQAYQVEAGHRPDLDIGQIVVTAVSSAAGGAAAGPVGDMIGNKLQNEAQGMGRRYLNGAITGTAAGFTGGLAGTVAAIPTQFAVIWAQEGFTATGWDKAMEQTMSTLPQQFGPLALVSGATNGLATGVSKVGAGHAFGNRGVNSESYRNHWGDRTFMDRMHDAAGGPGGRTGGLPPGTGGADGSGGLGGDGSRTSSPARTPTGPEGSTSPAGADHPGTHGTGGDGSSTDGARTGSPHDGAGDPSDEADGSGPGSGGTTTGDRGGTPGSGANSDGGATGAHSNTGAGSAPATDDGGPARGDSEPDAGSQVSHNGDSGDGQSSRPADAGAADRADSGDPAADRSGTAEHDGPASEPATAGGRDRGDDSDIAAGRQDGETSADRSDVRAVGDGDLGIADPAAGPASSDTPGPVAGAPVVGPAGGIPPAAPPVTSGGPAAPGTPGTTPGGSSPATPGSANTQHASGDSRAQPGPPGDSRTSSASDSGARARPGDRAGVGERAPYPGTDGNGVRAGRTGTPAADGDARRAADSQDPAGPRPAGDVTDGRIGPEDVLPLPLPGGPAGPHAPRDGGTRTSSRDSDSRAARRDEGSRTEPDDTADRSPEDTDAPDTEGFRTEPDPRNRGECARLTLEELKAETGSDRITPPEGSVGPEGMTRREIEDALGGKLYDYPDPGPDRSRHRAVADELLRQAARMDPRLIAAGRGPRAFVIDEYAGAGDEHGVGSHAYSMTVRMDPLTGEFRVDVSDPAAARRRGFPPDTPAGVRRVSATLLDGAGRILPPSGHDARVRPTVERFLRHGRPDFEVNRARRETQEQYTARREAEDADLRSLLQRRRAEYLRARAEQVEENGPAGLADLFRARAQEADSRAEQLRAEAGDRWDEARRTPKTRISDWPRDAEVPGRREEEDGPDRREDEDAPDRREDEEVPGRREGDDRGGYRRDEPDSGNDAGRYRYDAQPDEPQPYRPTDPGLAEQLAAASAVRLSQQTERDRLTAALRSLAVELGLAPPGDRADLRQLRPSRIGPRIDAERQRARDDGTLSDYERARKLADLDTLRFHSERYHRLVGRMTETSELLGEMGGLAYALDADLHPGAIQLTPFEGASTAKLVVDIAVLIPGTATDPPTLLIVEAKGADSALGGSRRADAQQGAPEYLRDTLAIDKNLATLLTETPARMRARGIDPDSAAGRAIVRAKDELLAAHREGTLRVEYHQVRTPATGAISVRRFDLERDGTPVRVDVIGGIDRTAPRHGNAGPADRGRSPEPGDTGPIPKTGDTQPVPAVDDTQPLPAVDPDRPAVDLLGAPDDDVWSGLDSAQVGERLRDELRARTGNPRFEVFGFDRPEVHPDIAREYARALVDMFREYPAAQLNSVGFRGLKPGVFGHTRWVLRDGVRRADSIEFNAFMATDPAAVRRGTDVNADSGWFPDVVRNRPAYARAVHEFGHVLDAAGGQRARRELNGRLMRRFFDSHPDATGIDDYFTWLRESLSGYSFYPDSPHPNPAEALAEAFLATTLRRVGDDGPVPADPDDPVRIIHDLLVESVRETPRTGVGWFLDEPVTPPPTRGPAGPETGGADAGADPGGGADRSRSGPAEPGPAERGTDNAPIEPDAIIPPLVIDIDGERIAFDLVPDGPDRWRLVPQGELPSATPERWAALRRELEAIRRMWPGREAQVKYPSGSGWDSRGQAAIADGVAGIPDVLNPVPAPPPAGPSPTPDHPVIGPAPEAGPADPTLLRIGQQAPVWIQNREHIPIIGRLSARMRDEAGEFVAMHPGDGAEYQPWLTDGTLDAARDQLLADLESRRISPEQALRDLLTVAARPDATARQQREILDALLDHGLLTRAEADALVDGPAEERDLRGSELPVGPPSEAESPADAARRLLDIELPDDSPETLARIIDEQQYRVARATGAIEGLAAAVRRYLIEQSLPYTMRDMPPAADTDRGIPRAEQPAALDDPSGRRPGEESGDFPGDDLFGEDDDPAPRRPGRYATPDPDGRPVPFRDEISFIDQNPMGRLLIEFLAAFGHEPGLLDTPPVENGADQLPMWGDGDELGRDQGLRRFFENALRRDQIRDELASWAAMRDLSLGDLLADPEGILDRLRAENIARSDRVAEFVEAARRALPDHDLADPVGDLLGRRIVRLPGGDGQPDRLVIVDGPRSREQVLADALAADSSLRHRLDTGELVLDYRTVRRDWTGETVLEPAPVPRMRYLRENILGRDLEVLLVRADNGTWHQVAGSAADHRAALGEAPPRAPQEIAAEIADTLRRLGIGPDTVTPEALARTVGDLLLDNAVRGVQLEALADFIRSATDIEVFNELTDARSRLAVRLGLDLVPDPAAPERTLTPESLVDRLADTGQRRALRAQQFGDLAEYAERLREVDADAVTAARDRLAQRLVPEELGRKMATRKAADRAGVDRRIAALLPPGYVDGPNGDRVFAVNPSGLDPKKLYQVIRRLERAGRGELVREALAEYANTLFDIDPYTEVPRGDRTADPRITDGRFPMHDRDAMGGLRDLIAEAVRAVGAGDFARAVADAANRPDSHAIPDDDPDRRPTADRDWARLVGVDLTGADDATFVRIYEAYRDGRIENHEGLAPGELATELDRLRQEVRERARQIASLAGLLDEYACSRRTGLPDGENGQLEAGDDEPPAAAPPGAGDAGDGSGKPPGPPPATPGDPGEDPGGPSEPDPALPDSHPELMDWIELRRAEIAVGAAADEAAWAGRQAADRLGDELLRFRAEQADRQLRYARERLDRIRLSQVDRAAWHARMDAHRARFLADIEPDNWLAGQRADLADWVARMAQQRARWWYDMLGSPGDDTGPESGAGDTGPDSDSGPPGPAPETGPVPEGEQEPDSTTPAEENTSVGGPDPRAGVSEDENPGTVDAEPAGPGDGPRTRPEEAGPRPPELLADALVDAIARCDELTARIAELAAGLRTHVDSGAFESTRLPDTLRELLARELDAGDRGRVEEIAGLMTRLLHAEEEVRRITGRIEYDRLVGERQGATREREFLRAEITDRARDLGLPDPGGWAGLGPEARERTVLRLDEETRYDSVEVPGGIDEVPRRDRDPVGERERQHRRERIRKLIARTAEFDEFGTQLRELDRQIAGMEHGREFLDRPRPADVTAELERSARERAAELRRIKPRRFMRDDLARRLGLVDENGDPLESPLSPGELDSTTRALRERAYQDFGRGALRPSQYQRRLLQIDALADAARDVNEAHHRIGRLQDEMARVAGVWRGLVEAEGGRMVTDRVGVVEGEQPRIIVFGPRPDPSDPRADHDAALDHALHNSLPAAQAMVRAETTVEYRRVLADRADNWRVEDMDPPQVERMSTGWVAGHRLDMTRWRDAAGDWHPVDPTRPGWYTDQDAPGLPDRFGRKDLPDGVSGWASEDVVNDIVLPAENVPAGKIPESTLPVNAPMAPNQYDTSGVDPKDLYTQHWGADAYNVMRLLLMAALVPKHPAVKAWIQRHPEIGRWVQARPWLQKLPPFGTVFRGYEWFAPPETNVQPMHRRWQESDHIPPTAMNEIPEGLRREWEREAEQWAEVQRWADREYDRFLGDETDLGRVAAGIAAYREAQQRVAAQEFVDLVRARLVEEIGGIDPLGDLPAHLAAIDAAIGRVADEAGDLFAVDDPERTRNTVEHVREMLLGTVDPARIVPGADPDAIVRAVDPAEIAEQLIGQMREEVPRFTRAELEQIKNHLMRDEHWVRDADDPDGDMVRQPMDRLADIAEAWNRLGAGEALPADIVLLQDALAEARYLADHPDATWQAANTHAIGQGHHWDSQRPPLTEWRAGRRYALPPLEPNAQYLPPGSRGTENTSPVRDGGPPVPGEQSGDPGRDGAARGGATRGDRPGGPDTAQQRPPVHDGGTRELPAEPDGNSPDDPGAPEPAPGSGPPPPPRDPGDPGEAGHEPAAEHANSGPAPVEPAQRRTGPGQDPSGREPVIAGSGPEAAGPGADGRFTASTRREPASDGPAGPPGTADDAGRDDSGSGSGSRANRTGDPDPPRGEDPTGRRRIPVPRGSSLRPHIPHPPREREFHFPPPFENEQIPWPVQLSDLIPEQQPPLPPDPPQPPGPPSPHGPQDPPEQPRPPAPPQPPNQPHPPAPPQHPAPPMPPVHPTPPDPPMPEPPHPPIPPPGLPDPPGPPVPPNSPHPPTSPGPPVPPAPPWLPQPPDRPDPPAHPVPPGPPQLPGPPGSPAPPTQPPRPPVGPEPPQSPEPPPPGRPGTPDTQVPGPAAPEYPRPDRPLQPYPTTPGPYRPPVPADPPGHPPLGGLPPGSPGGDERGNPAAQIPPGAPPVMPPPLGGQPPGGSRSRHRARPGMPQGGGPPATPPGVVGEGARPLVVRPFAGFGVPSEFDPRTGALRAAPTAAGRIEGFYGEIAGLPVVLYRRNGRLELRIGAQTIDLAGPVMVEMATVAYRTTRFALIQDGHRLGELTYRSLPEELDFGAYLRDVLADPQRRAQVFAP